MHRDKVVNWSSAARARAGGSGFATEVNCENEHQGRRDVIQVDDEAVEPSETGTSASVFERAREHIEMGWLFRTVTYIYAERKTLMCCFVHFVATMTIFGHYFLVKFRQREMEVWSEENRYWWKRLAPALEFAMAHTAMLQMALLPLTMCRLSIVLTSENVALSNFIPFNRMVRFHIHLGYTMILTICGATLVSVTYIGLVCSDGEEKFCQKFSSEIMVTGYFMLAMLVTVLISSCLRHVIPYRIFYLLHHLVFAMYLLTAVHTFDRVQRNHERERSQTFKWFSAAVLYYICDRAAMAMNHSYKTTVVSSSIVASTHQQQHDDNNTAGSKMVVITLMRPPLFRFHPGQYAFLRIRDIDNEYHPFSIASSPDSEFIEFYIEVFAPGSWTHKLWELMDEPAKMQRESLGRRIVVDMIGPYGTSLGDPKEYSHAIGIGSGTGIVPMMSLLKQHVQQLIRLDADQHFRVQERHQKKIYDIHHASHQRMGSVADKMVEFFFRMLCCRKNENARNVGDNRSVSVKLKALTTHHRDAEDGRGARGHVALREVRREARRAALPIYGTVALLFLPPLGVACLGLTFSFHSLGAPYRWMEPVLFACTITFHALFAVVTLGVQDISEFKTYLDIAFLIIAGLADWFYFERDLWGRFKAEFLVYFALLNGYMILSSWYNATKSRRQHWRNQVMTDGIVTMDKVKFIWVTRSAALVSKLYPDIDNLWMSLRQAWGDEPTHEVCEIAIYVTDRNKEACAILREELGESELYRSGGVKFERPDFSKIIEDHTIELIVNPKMPMSNTLLAFCGNPNLSVMVNQAKISNDISTVLTNHNLHTMEFVSESYGGVSKGGAGGNKTRSKITANPTTSTVSTPSGDHIPSDALGAAAEEELMEEAGSPPPSKRSLSSRRFRVHDTPSLEEHYHQHKNGMLLEEEFMGAAPHSRRSFSSESLQTGETGFQEFHSEAASHPFSLSQEEGMTADTEGFVGNSGGRLL